MKIFEIGTGYTSIPARMGAATEIVVEELTRSMLKMHYDVSIVDIRDSSRVPNDLPIIEVPVPASITSTDTTLNLLHKMKRVVYSISLARTLRGILKKSKDENIVLHFHNQYNLFFFYLLTSRKMRSRARIAYTVHSYIWQSKWKAIAGVARKKYFQEIYCVKRADRVFVLNDQTAETFRIQFKIAPEKIVKILNGVNTDVYCGLNSEDEAAVRGALHLENKTVFFHAGSVCERKNQLGALHLLMPLLKAHKNFCFVYAGGIISAEYQEMIRDCALANSVADQVIYAGELTPGKMLNEYYGISAALAFPSEREGFSLVILEALSTGLPVLVNARSNLQLPRGCDACCLRYDSPESFTALVREQILSGERRAEISGIAKNAIRDGYSWDAVARKYIEAF
jgi:glycosyltransferase involved in cell wall biosynthesis